MGSDGPACSGGVGDREHAPPTMIARARIDRRTDPGASRPCCDGMNDIGRSIDAHARQACRRISQHAHCLRPGVLRAFEGTAPDGVATGSRYKRRARMSNPSSGCFCFDAPACIRRRCSTAARNSSTRAMACPASTPGHGHTGAAPRHRRAAALQKRALHASHAAARVRPSSLRCMHACRQAGAVRARLRYSVLTRVKRTMPGPCESKKPSKQPDCPR